jgi:hypothetical protein
LRAKTVKVNTTFQVVSRVAYRKRLYKLAWRRQLTVNDLLMGEIKTNTFFMNGFSPFGKGF